MNANTRDNLSLHDHMYKHDTLKNMGKEKITPPPFENLMSYETMRTINKNVDSKLDLKTCKNFPDSPMPQKRSCLDSMKTHSGLIASIAEYNQSNAHIADVKGSHNSNGWTIVEDGCYNARKVIIERAETLTSFLHEGCDASDSCNSTDSDSLGDEGYSTDSQNPCPLTNLSSSSSSLVSSEGDIAPLQITGILKLPGAAKKKVTCRKKVTFVSLPKKSKHSVKSSDKSLEQKIKALSIISEESETDSRGVNVDSRGLTADSHHANGYNVRESRLHYNAILDNSRTVENSTSKMPLTSAINSIKSERKFDITDLPRCLPNNELKHESNYENIPETRTECITMLRHSRLPQSPNIPIPTNFNISKNRNSVACPYNMQDVRSRSLTCDDIVTKPTKQPVTRTSSNNVPLQSPASTFASSSDILKLFQNTKRISNERTSVSPSRTSNKSDINFISTSCKNRSETIPNDSCTTKLLNPKQTNKIQSNLRSKSPETSRKSHSKSPTRHNNLTKTNSHPVRPHSSQSNVKSNDSKSNFLTSNTHQSNVISSSNHQSNVIINDSKSNFLTSNTHQSNFLTTNSHQSNVMSSTNHQSNVMSSNSHQSNVISSTNHQSTSLRIHPVLQNIESEYENVKTKSVLPKSPLCRQSSLPVPNSRHSLSVDPNQENKRLPRARVSSSKLNTLV